MTTVDSSTALEPVAPQPLDALVGQTVSEAIDQVDEIKRQIDELAQDETSAEAELFSSSVRTLAETVSTLIAAVEAQASQQIVTAQQNPSVVTAANAVLEEANENKVDEVEKEKGPSPIARLKGVTSRLPKVRRPNLRALEMHHYVWLVSGLVWVAIMVAIGFATLGGSDAKTDPAVPGEGVTADAHAPTAATHAPAENGHDAETHAPAGAESHAAEAPATAH